MNKTWNAKWVLSVIFVLPVLALVIFFFGLSISYAGTGGGTLSTQDGNGSGSGNCLNNGEANSPGKCIACPKGIIGGQTCESDSTWSRCGNC